MKIDKIDLKSGNLYTIIGANNSGKSQFGLRLAKITDSKDENISIAINGENVHIKSIGYLPTNPRDLFSGIGLTLEDEFDLNWSFFGLNKFELEEDLDKLIELLDLNSLLKNDPFTLSGGEAVKAALALILISKPKVLIIDQTFEYVNVSSLKQIFNAIYSLGEHKTSVIELLSKFPHFYDENQFKHCHEAQKINIDWRCYKARIENFKIANRPLSEKNNLTSITDNIAIEIKDLTYRYPNNEFSLNIPEFIGKKGERIAITGENGVGKSTFLKCLSLLLIPNFSKFYILDKFGIKIHPDLKKTHLWPRHALYCFQFPDEQLYLPTVEDEINHTFETLTKSTLSEHNKMNITNRLGLTQYLGNSPFDVPKAIQRLIPICACALVSPDVVLLDEPSTFLDEEHTEWLATLLKSKPFEKSIIIFVSHDSEFINKVATKLFKL